MTTLPLSWTDLRRAGWTRDRLADALASGQLRRVRRGWYVDASVAPAVASASAAGGRLTCTDALRLGGVWVLPAPEIHVRISRGTSGRAAPGVRRFWTDERLRPGVDDLAAALRHAVDCLDLRAMVVVADSVLNRGLLSWSGLEALLDARPRWRSVARLADPRAESGAETLVRLAMRRHRLRVTPQVVIDGVGRVDLLVGQRLIIEVDGYEWHGDRAAFERDRARDRELVRRGYAVMRVSYRQALGDLDQVMLGVLDVVRRREHLWRGVRARTLTQGRSRPPRVDETPSA